MAERETDLEKVFRVVRKLRVENQESFATRIVNPNVVVAHTDIRRVGLLGPGKLKLAVYHGRSESQGEYVQGEIVFRSEHCDHRNNPDWCYVAKCSTVNPGPFVAVSGRYAKVRTLFGNEEHYDSADAKTSMPDEIALSLLEGLEPELLEPGEFDFRNYGADDERKKLLKLFDLFWGN